MQSQKYFFMLCVNQAFSKDTNLSEKITAESEPFQVDLIKAQRDFAELQNFTMMMMMMRPLMRIS